MSSGWPDNRHQPTISHSSLAKFLECDRAYALQYHHSVISDVSKRFGHKREARLQPLNCFPGSIFHDTVQDALLTYQKSGAYPTDFMAIARNITREYISFSREWVADTKQYPILGGLHRYWPDHPFAQPVEPFYYEGDFPKDYRAKIKGKLERWFDRFFALAPDLPFSDVPPKNWLFPKQLGKKAPWFVHNNKFAVYAAFDFLTRVGDQITIYDWKTGNRQRGESAVADQLITYAAFAISQWNADPESIKLFAVWVDDGSVQEVECDKWEIRRLEEKWEKYQSDWSARLNAANGSGEKLFDLFPMTSNLRTCSRCVFRTCEGSGRVRPNVYPIEEIDFWDP